MTTAHRRAEHLGDFTVDRRMLAITGWALPIGAAAAGAAWILLRLIGAITNAVFYQRWDTRLVAPDSHHQPTALTVLAPVLGGLLVGALARFGSEKIRGHGMPEAIEAILTGGSKVAPRVAVLKPISAAISIGTGGPFGAEGPIIMTGGAVGSMMAQLFRLSADERKTLLVAGAAGGMAATFNSPLAAVLLAVELLLFEWRPRSFVPVVAAVAVATVVRVPLLGSGALFAVSTSGVHLSASAEALCLIAGITGGLLAVAATYLVYLAEDAFNRLPFHWMWWPAIGGLVIGLGGLVEPRALGVGYDVIDQLLIGRAGFSLIVGILLVKTVIWSVSLGSGTSGGVLAPVFMIGGALGALEGYVLPAVFPGFWAMMGLAAVVGGVMRSPLTGVVFTLELTHAWTVVLPLLIASTSAYAISALVLKRSVLTEKIARRGLHLTREYSTDPLDTFFADEVMLTDFACFDMDSAVAEPAPDQRLYPVLDHADHLAGIVTSSALTLAADTGLTVADVLVRDPVAVHHDDTLRHIANVFAEHAITRAPVVDRGDPGRVLGVIRLADLLKARLHDLSEEHHREAHLRPTRRLRRPRARGPEVLPGRLTS